MKEFCAGTLMAVFITVCPGSKVLAQPRIRGVDSGKITVVVEPYFKDQPLRLHEQYYVDDARDTLYIDAFKIYLTNFRFSGASAGTKPACNHLFDAADPASYAVTFDPNPGMEYLELSFTAGVDSVMNTSGANEGDLDPAKGMYWTWNSGYIMAKLEGRSSSCDTRLHVFEFHIGGYQPPYQAERVISRLPTAFTWEETTDLSTVHSPRVQTRAVVIRIKADVSAWFRSVSLARTNSVVIPGKDAAMMADNYAHMFSVEEIKRY